MHGGDFSRTEEDCQRCKDSSPLTSENSDALLRGMEGRLRHTHVAFRCSTTGWSFWSSSRHTPPWMTHLNVCHPFQDGIASRRLLFYYCLLPVSIPNSRLPSNINDQAVMLKMRSCLPQNSFVGTRKGGNATALGPQWDARLEPSAVWINQLSADSRKTP